MWLLCDPSQISSLGRDQIYKSLAFIALLQKGKPLDPKILDSYGDKGVLLFTHTLRENVNLGHVCLFALSLSLPPLHMHFVKMLIWAPNSHLPSHTLSYLLVHVHVHVTMDILGCHTSYYIWRCGQNKGMSITAVYSLIELPIPDIGQLSDVRDLCGRFIRATNPTELGYTYEEIKSFDEVNVTLMSEKKGSLLHKHNEYTVQSKVHVNCTCEYD